MENKNIEKIKSLAKEIETKELQEDAEKKETVSCLKKIQSMLCGSNVKKQVVLQELKSLIAKLS
jgi:hypothetical protein